MDYNWNTDKNKQLKETRGISFLDVVESISNGMVLEDEEHPNQNK
jgi:uncharacterized DUF497 family protein